MRMRVELRPYSHRADLPLMPPRASEADSADEELATMGEVRGHGPAFTLWRDGFPVGAAGVIVFRGGVGEAWLRGSTRMDLCPLMCARLVRRMLEEIVDEHRLHRVQATVRADNAQAVRFLTWLGFESEGLLRKLGADASDYLMMAIVR